MPDSTTFFPSPASFAACAARLRAQTGGRRAGLAFLFGSLAALAFPPVNFVPVFWLSFPALIFLLQGTAKARQAFITGWCFAFGMLVFGLYWIAASMFVDIARFWWAVPLAVAGLPAVLAIYYGLAAMAARALGLRGVSGALGFALAWFLASYARGHLFTGFPWNLEGYGWSGVLPVLQITSVIGIYGLTLITLVCASLLATLAEKGHGRIVIASLALLALTGGWGVWRLHDATGATVPDVRLRLVQPDIKQENKWSQGTRELNFARLLELSSVPNGKPVTDIIWPETAATFYLAEDPDHRNAIAQFVPDNGAVITGVIRRELNAASTMSFYNSLVALDERGDITAVYDKHHLVPYGEYVPFREYLPLPTVAGLGLDFYAGPGPRTLRVKGLPPFSPLICYEAIFPGEVALRNDRPQFLLNVTNDGWYGRTSGPYQHFAIARTRAIEEGLPLVRAANTGISGVVDAYGRVTARLGLGKSGYLDADLPAALPPTCFVERGQKILWFLFGALVLIMVISRRSGKS